MVDSGTFSILIDGRKVGTETFTIRQSAESSIASSEIKIDDGTSKARQTSEFRISPKGELQRYEWHELAPEKSEIVVEPQEEFLVEHITSEKDKKFDQPFLVPATTLVLDDFFFSHREILDLAIPVVHLQARERRYSVYPAEIAVRRDCSPATYVHCRLDRIHGPRACADSWKRDGVEPLPDHFGRARPTGIYGSTAIRRWCAS